MKNKILFFGIVLATLMSWSCNKDDDPEFIASKLEHVEFTSEALQDNVAGNPTLRDMTVYLPEGYDPVSSERYPVVYLLHGLPFSDSAYISSSLWDEWIDPNGLFQTYPDFPLGGFRPWMDELIRQGQVEPMIVAMPDAKTLPYGFCMYTNSALNGNFEDFIAEDVVGFIDANYRTIANKDGRAVIGHSQGGYGAIKLGMKRSDKFGTVAAHSAPLFLGAFQANFPAIIAENPDGLTGPDPTKFLTSSIYAFAAAWSPNLDNPPFMVDLPFEFPSGQIIESVWMRWLEHDPATMLQNYLTDFRSLNGIYFDAGLQDVFQFHLLADAFHQVLDANGVNHTYQNYEGDHFDQAFARLEESLKFCSSTMDN